MRLAERFLSTMAAPNKSTLTCHIDKKWVDQWNPNVSHVRLCFGISVNNAFPISIAAAVEAVTGSVSFIWSNAISIAASKDRFPLGELVIPSTEPTPIVQGERYILGENWTSGAVERYPLHDDAAPRDGNGGIFFCNGAQPAACVLCCEMNGGVSPFFATPYLHPPCNPRGGWRVADGRRRRVAVWFQDDVADGQVIESNTPDFFYLSVDDVRGTAHVRFDATGRWSVVPAGQ